MRSPISIVATHSMTLCKFGLSIFKLYATSTIIGNAIRRGVGKGARNRPKKAGKKLQGEQE
jgi:hypothetical protein